MRTLELPALEYLFNLTDGQVVSTCMVSNLSAQRKSVTLLLEIEKESFRQIIGSSFPVCITSLHSEPRLQNAQRVELFRVPVAHGYR